MANVNINCDTVKSTLKVTLDDKNISDVQEVRVYNYIPYDSEEQKVRVEIISGTQDKDSGITRTTITTCADEHIEIKDAVTDGLIQALKL